MAVRFYGGFSTKEKKKREGSSRHTPRVRIDLPHLPGRNTAEEWYQDGGQESHSYQDKTNVNLAAVRMEMILSFRRPRVSAGHENLGINRSKLHCQRHRYT